MSLSPAARQKSKPKAKKAQPMGLNHPTDRTCSTQSMGEDAADSVDELKAGPRRAETSFGLLQAGEAV